MDYDVIVIGSGPGGYHAALRAAQLGLKTACVERDAVGGVCLNTGCIPTKALLHTAENLLEMRHASRFGISAAAPEVDVEGLEAWKQSVVKKMTGGVRQLFKGNRVDVLEGEARLAGERRVEVGGQGYEAGAIILATGSSPMVVPGFEPEGHRIVDSTGALDVPEVPERFLAIGGSAIGLEFADVYDALGSQVTVVELMDEIVPTADRQVIASLRKGFEARGIDVRTATKAVEKRETEEGLEVTLEAGDGERDTLVVDKILVAVGRRPNSGSLALEAAGVDVDEKGFVPVDDHMRTNVPHVYAIGDLARPPLLAHKAMKEGLVAAEHAAGQPSAYDTLVPAVIYTHPEYAAVGMTEAEAQEAGYEVRTGTFPMAASGRAASLGQSDGLVKLVGDADSDLLLGAHMVGPDAGELISEATLALEMGATLEDVALTQHAHPTVAETLMEAAEHAHGKAIHIANRRKR